RARVWDPSDPEPDEWQREVTVRAARTGWVGARVAIGDGVSNTLPLTFSHDDFTATTLRPAGGPLWSTDTDDYPMRLSVGGIPVVVTACSGSSNPQTFTLDEPLPLARPDRAPVALWDPRPTGLCGEGRRVRARAVDRRADECRVSGRHVAGRREGPRVRARRGLRPRRPHPRGRAQRAARRRRVTGRDAGEPW